jgi:hypothetical protein
LSIGVASEVDVIRDRTGVEYRERIERRSRVDNLRLAHVLQRQPDLGAIRCRRDIRAERRSLRDASDDPGAAFAQVPFWDYTAQCASSLFER